MALIYRAVVALTILCSGVAKLVAEWRADRGIPADDPLPRDAFSEATEEEELLRLAHVVFIPTQEEVQEALLDKRKRELMEQYLPPEAIDEEMANG